MDRKSKTKLFWRWLQVLDSREISGAPGGNRTPDPLLRRQTLYPTELRAHGAIYFTINHLQLLLRAFHLQLSVQSVQQRVFRTGFWEVRSQIQPPLLQLIASQLPRTNVSRPPTSSLACGPSKK